MLMFNKYSANKQSENKQSANNNNQKISACFQEYIQKITKITFQRIVEQYKWKIINKKLID